MAEDTTVRVRFAPSPTGFFHVGGARTALFNWLYARHTGGKFVLRIEDTDKERSTPEFLQPILDGLRWLGLDWDEGPEVGGDAGPYFQSQRGAIYQEYLQKLLDAGRAYESEGAIFFRLEGERTTEYDEHLGREVEKVKAAPQVIDDEVRGKVERAETRDFVIVRSSGDPVFHFVNVVDDIAMGITHVIRGEDHLSNTSKHCELFEAFGVKKPAFAHIPLILKEEGSGKMSKRDKGALVDEYMAEGYLPEAVRNFLCLLGWNPKGDREIMPIQEIIAAFDFPGIQKGNARFDRKKLAHFNSEYLRALPLDKYRERALPKLRDAGLVDDATDAAYLDGVLKLCQPKVAHVDELPGYARFFFRDDFEPEAKPLKKMANKGDPAARASELSAALDLVEPWTEASIQAAIEELASSTGEKVFAYYPVARMAVSGTGSGPDLIPLLAALGKDRVVDRLHDFPKMLEGVA